MRRLTIATTLMLLGVVYSAFARSAPATRPAARPAPARPPLFLSESWKGLTTPPDDHGAWPASQEGVANPNLQLTLHGTSGKEIQLVAVRGSSDVYPVNLWTGTTPSQIGRAHV